VQWICFLRLFSLNSEDSPLLGDVSCGFLHFVFDARVHGFTHLPFVCRYFTIPNLSLLVLVMIHCDFNKFHFGFFNFFFFLRFYIC
jgi:hypothetical protein